MQIIYRIQDINEITNCFHQIFDRLDEVKSRFLRERNGKIGEKEKEEKSIRDWKGNSTFFNDLLLFSIIRIMVYCLQTMRLILKFS